ncbi:MAG: hypothetical protein HW387_1776 [Parachlamydiales bacterium]|nr:hypothetical protein [Parachlamydiales bacterium]
MRFFDRFGPETTSRALWLLIISLGIGGLATGLFYHILAPILALTLPSIQQGWIWQLATYPLVLHGPIGFSSLVGLTFDLLVLWIFGTTFIEQKGIKSFFTLFCGATLFGALSGLAGMILAQGMLAGFTPAVFALLTAWMLMNSGAQVWFFVLIPAKWAIGFLLAVNLLSHMSHSAWAAFMADSSGVLFGYLFCKIPGWKWKRRSIPTKSYPKIYDIRTKEPILSDDQFMDAMLAKISQYGEQRLTDEEKQRMRKISENKRKGR